MAWFARSLLAIVQGWKDRGLTPDKVTSAGGSEFAKPAAKHQLTLR